MILQEAIKAFDLETWLAGHGGEAQNREWVLRCPTCGKNNLAVNVQRRLWHCWTCERYVVDVEGKRRAVQGAGGLLKLIQLLDGLDRTAAITKLQSGAIFSHKSTRECPADLELGQKYLAAIREPEPISPPEGWQPIREVLPFMRERQITLADAKQFGLGWCNSGRYAGRLIFPVWEQGRLLYFQARAMWSPQSGRRYLKSLNPPATDRSAVSSELLMNLDLARLYPRVAIVEGPTDLVRVGPDAVCTFGKRITASQIGRLLRARVRAVDLVWDSDAREEMVSAAKVLDGLFDLRLVFLPEGDPGDLSRVQLARARMRSVRLADVSALRRL